jgi:hypothetical protein
MKNAAAGACLIVLSASVALTCGVALSDSTPRPATGSAPPFGILVGQWTRTQGAYVITIDAVDDAGKLDAGYANPKPLPFYRAEATRDGNTIKLFFELRASGYGGSTYALSYDPASDSLRGVYDQVVVRQKFDVVFNRTK